MSVEFEPIRLGRRRRRLDPASVGVIAVAIALGAAVLKPWGGGPVAEPPVQATPRATASGSSAGADPSPTGSLPNVVAAEAAPSLRWEAIEHVIQPHDAWGIRAIVVRSLPAQEPADAPRYGERWFRFPSGGTDVTTTLVDPSDAAIVALGVTFPPAHTPLDVRIWRVHIGGSDWIDTQPVNPVPSAGAFLYLRPIDAGGQLRTWPAGRYQLDALVDGSIRRLGVTIPDRFSNVPESIRPSLREVGPLPDPADAILADVPLGVFATVDGRGVPLAAEKGPALDEAAAWLDVDPGTRRAPRSFVAVAHLPRATGLGVMLPEGSAVQDATLVRLAPGPLPGEPRRVDRASVDGSTTSSVLFRAPGGSWRPGVYRLTVAWADAVGLHERSWHAELRPGVVREAPRLLASARAWARYAGSTGVVVGTAEPLEGGPRSSVIRLVRVRPEPDIVVDAAGPVSSKVDCAGATVDGHPGVMGLAYPTDRYETVVRASTQQATLRREDQVVLTAAFGVRGLLLVAPARSPTLPSATWRFSVGMGTTAESYALCIGTAVDGN